MAIWLSSVVPGAPRPATVNHREGLRAAPAPRTSQHRAHPAPAATSPIDPPAARPPSSTPDAARRSAIRPLLAFSILPIAAILAIATAFLFLPREHAVEQRGEVLSGVSPLVADGMRQQPRAGRLAPDATGEHAIHAGADVPEGPRSRSVEGFPAIVAPATPAAPEELAPQQWRETARWIAAVTAVCILVVLASAWRIMTVLNRSLAALGTAQAMRAIAERTAARLRAADSARQQAAEEAARLSRDLERRIEAQETDLRAASEALEAFSRVVARDLRSPLGTVVSCAMQLKSDSGKPLDGNGRLLVNAIVDAGLDMDRLVGSLLTMARIGQTACVRSRVNLSDIVRQVLNELPRKSRSPRLAARIAPGVWADADPALVRMALAHLVSSAVRSGRTVAQPVLVFGCEPTPDGPCYFVLDNGVGGEPGLADTGAHRQSRGLPEPGAFEASGIDLATARRIIERHGGRLTVHSVRGEGTTVHFTLGPGDRGPDTDTGTRNLRQR